MAFVQLSTTIPLFHPLSPSLPLFSFSLARVSFYMSLLVLCVNNVLTLTHTSDHKRKEMLAEVVVVAVVQETLQKHTKMKTTFAINVCCRL